MIIASEKSYQNLSEQIQFSFNFFLITFFFIISRITFYICSFCDIRSQTTRSTPYGFRKSSTFPLAGALQLLVCYLLQTFSSNFFSFIIKLQTWLHTENSIPNLVQLNLIWIVITLSDRFSTKWNSVWCPIKQKSVITIQTKFGL